MFEGNDVQNAFAFVIGRVKNKSVKIHKMHGPRTPSIRTLIRRPLISVHRCFGGRVKWEATVKIRTPFSCPFQAGQYPDGQKPDRRSLENRDRIKSKIYGPG